MTDHERESDKHLIDPSVHTASAENDKIPGLTQEVPDESRSNDAPVYGLPDSGMMGDPSGVNGGKHGNETRTLNQLLTAGFLHPGSVLRVPMERGLTSVKGTVTAAGDIQAEDGGLFHSPSSFVTHFKGYCTGLDMIKVENTGKTLGVLHRDYRKKMGLTIKAQFLPPLEHKDTSVNDPDKHGGVTIEHGKEHTPANLSTDEHGKAVGDEQQQQHEAWGYATAEPTYDQSLTSTMTTVTTSKRKRESSGNADGEDKQRYVTLRELFDAGLVKAGATIEYQWRRNDGQKKAIVTDSGKLHVEDGREFQSLYEWKKSLGGTVQGLSFFKVLDTGRYLSELKEEFLARMLAATGSTANPSPRNRSYSKASRQRTEDKDKGDYDKNLENPVAVQVRDCMTRVKGLEAKVATLLDVVKKLTGHQLDGSAHGQ